LNRNAALDGLRGCAILLVIFFHAGVPGFAGGFVGVDIFFVLSGFLITSLLMDEIERTGTLDFVAFYMRRALRLYPALLLMLAAYIIAGARFWPTEPRPFHALIAGLYLTDYSRAYFGIPTTIEHTWSLAIEEHYYLIWPLLLIAIARWPRRARITFLIALYALATAWRIYRAGHAEWDVVYHSFDSHCSGLLAGSLAAQFRKDDAAGWRERALALAVCAGATAVPLLLVTAAVRTSLFGLPAIVMEFLSAFVIFMLLNRKNPAWRIFAFPPLVWTGTISYALYLWHGPLLKAYGYDEQHLWPDLPIALALIFGIAIFSWFAVERPAQALRHRWTRAAPAPA